MRGRTMRFGKELAILLCTLTATVAAPRSGHGQATVFCANCSSMVQQLISNAKQVEQLAKEASQLQTQIRMYTNMITNTTQLPMAVYASVQGDIAQVRSIANAGQLLAGNSGSILNRLNTAGAYADEVSGMPRNMTSQFNMWQTSLGNAGTTLGRTLGLQQQQEINYTATQAAIQAQSTSAIGQMQAIQAGNEMAALTNTQLQQIHTTLVAATQAAETDRAVSAERQALADAALAKFLSANPYDTTGRKAYGY
jgi:P-type conjugative transfer protein TrbJ